MVESNKKEEILVELEYVFIRLSSASNKEQLENFVNKNLSILFHHLSSSDDEIRSKVVEICTQLHRRLKNNSDVILPVNSLLEMYKNPETNSFVKNFSFVYLKIGFPRLDVGSQLALLPIIMIASRNKPKSQKLSLFSMAVPLFNRISELNDDSLKKFNFDFTDYSSFADFFEFLNQILQLPYFGSGPVRVRRILSLTGASFQNQSFNPAQADAMEIDDDDDDDGDHHMDIGHADGNESEFVSFGIPGMCKVVYSHLTTDSFSKEFKTNPVLLEKVKCGIVKFLSKLNVEFSNKTAWLLIVASADSIHTVVDAAEGQMKKIADREDKESVEKLFTVFLGNEKSKNVTSDERRSPSSLRLKLKILTYFNRIAFASKSFPHNIQIVFEGLFGSHTSPKSMLMSVYFGRSVAANLSGKSAAVFGPLLLSAAERLVNEYDDEKLLCSGYRLMGDLGKVCYSMIVKDVGKVHKYFEDLSKESEDVSSAIQDCLVAWSDVFMEHADTSNKSLLEALILAYVDHKSSKCRLTSLKYLEKICSVHNVESRFALFVACGDSDELVRKEALRILRFDEHSGSKPDDIYPSFDEAAPFCVQKINSKKVAGSKELPYKVESMKEMIKYLNICLEKTIGTEKISLVLKNYIKISIDSRGSFEECSIFDYFRLLVELVDTYSSNEPLFLFTLRDLVIPSGNYFVDYLKEKLNFFENLAQTSTKSDVCNVICDLYGFTFCGTTKSDDAYAEKLRSLILLASQAVDLVVGHCLLLSYVVYYAKEHTRRKFESDFKKAQEIFISRLNEHEKSSTNLFLAAFGLKIMLKRSSISTDDDKTLFLIKFLLQIIQSRKENMTIKLKEQTIDVLAWICVGRTSSSLFEIVLEGLSKIGEIPSDIELQIMAGEAFIVCCDCHREDSQLLTIDELLAKERLTFLLNFLLKTIASLENRHMKQALGNWFYILLEHFGTEQIVNDRLIDIQTVLLDCLAESNEFTQDTSCRALAFVFQQAKDIQKDGLIISLLEKLNSPNAKETLLPYQELCALATFIGNRQTIYIFMQLAVQNRKGELKKCNISTDAYKQLESYFEKVIPFLYRATYDPSPKVQASMKVIWSSLQSERKSSLVKDYAAQVVKYLVANLTNKVWRVRESCCLALSDFLTSNSGDLASDYLADLWQILFRVCDDVKESVRLAATKCVLTLHKVTIKLCCPEPGLVKVKVLDSVLPVLLAGLESTVKEVNALSLVTLTVLSREAGAKLKDHLAVIIPSLLDSLSTMEPQAVNYFAVRASGQEAEVLDQARAAASKSSPMMDAVEYCVRFVDADVLAELAPKITSILQSSIGLATKTGSCRLINLLCVQCPLEMKLHADKFLKSLTFHGLLDRNSTVRKHASASIGLLVKFCSESALNHLFSKVESWFLDVESGKSQSMCAYFLRAVANENPELLKSYGNILIPIVFMAVNGDSSSTNVIDDTTQNDLKQVWQEVWNELASGTDLAVKMYIDDILNFCLRIFSASSNWTVKAQTLQALSSLADKHSSYMNDEKLTVLINTLFSALQGRTWSGKEKILQTLASLFKQSESRLMNIFSPVSKGDLFAILIKECKKSNLVYRTSAIECTGVFCKCFQWAEGFEILFALLEAFLKKDKNLYDSDDEKNSPKAGSKEFNEVTEFFTVSYASLSRSNSIVVEGYEDSLKKFGSLCLNQLNNCLWKIQLAILDALCQFLQNHLTFVDVKSLTLVVIDTYENAVQTSIKDACIEILRLSCTLLMSCSEKLDVSRLKIISNDNYCKESYPELVTIIETLML